MTIFRKRESPACGLIGGGFMKDSIRAKRKYAPVLDRMGEPATIDMFADSRYLSGEGSDRGKLCGSGDNFVQIEPDGTVVRCGTEICHGNNPQKNVSLLHAPAVCDASYCPYFCEKYTSPQYAGAHLPQVRAS